MRHGQKRFLTALTGACAAFTVAVVPLAPSQAEPSLDDVKEKVDRLYTQAEVASERYNDARIERDELVRELHAVEADEAAQRAVVRRIEASVDEAIAAQYEGHVLSASGELLATEDPGAFLGTLTTLSAYNDIQAEALSDYDTARKALDIRHRAVAARKAQLAAVADRLADAKGDVEEKLDEAQETLDELEAKDRERYIAEVSRGQVAPEDVPKVAASGRAGAAIAFAMAQIGDMYLWGAAGPDRWDCSGLTMVAWAQAGVSLPHSSAAQAGMGTPVSRDQLQPGDLIFYYSPISHVALYIGGGKVVHATHSGAPVQVTSMDYMPYTSAVRVG